MSDEGGGAVDNVKEAFQGKRGKVLLIGGGAAIAAYVWWTRRNGTPEPVPAEDPTVADGPSGRTPQTDPEVGNTSTGSTTGPRKYTNNADWLADGTSFLQGRGTPAGNAYDALTKALGGLPLSQQEIAWVSQVIGALGAPPEGMPPLNAQAPPTTGGGTTTPPPGNKPLAPGVGWDWVRKGDTLAKIAARWHTTEAALRKFNTANGLNRLTPGEAIRIRGKAGPRPTHKK